MRNRRKTSLPLRGGVVALLLLSTLLGALVLIFRHPLYHIVMASPADKKISISDLSPTTLPERRTVAEVLKLCDPKVAARFAPLCKAQGIAYPPKRLRLLAFKQERILDVWAADASGAYVFLAEYPIRAASGTTGPKRREGDLQVPEGFYRLTTLNPMSRFHVSLRVDYPNADDIAANPGVPKSSLGGDIYVHGGAASIGCLAMGDAVIEEIFCLAAHTEVADREIWIAPVDPRHGPMPETNDPNLRDRYTRLTHRIAAMRR